MSRKFLLTTTCCLAILICARPASAQITSKLAFNVGAGFTQPVIHSDSRLDTGFNITAGAGVNFNPRVGVMAEFGFNHMEVSGTELTAVGAPDGSARIYSVTLEPIFHLTPHRRFDAYVIGGGGYYRRTVEFTQPTVFTTATFDPFLGGFVPVGVVGNQVLGSFTQNKAGWNIGSGVSVRVRGDSNLKFYAEARYHQIHTTPVYTNMLPVTFGFRW